MLRFIFSLSIGLIAAAPVHAGQTPAFSINNFPASWQITASDGTAPLGSQADAAWAGSGNGSLVALGKAIAAALQSRLLVSDNQSAAYSDAPVMTIGTSTTAGRGVAAICTAAGNVTLQLATTTIAWPVNVGGNVLPFAASAVNSATATCVYTNLK